VCQAVLETVEISPRASRSASSHPRPQLGVRQCANFGRGAGTSATDTTSRLANAGGRAASSASLPRAPAAHAVSGRPGAALGSSRVAGQHRARRSERPCDRQTRAVAGRRRRAHDPPRSFWRPSVRRAVEEAFDAQDERASRRSQTMRRQRLGESLLCSASRFVEHEIGAGVRAAPWRSLTRLRRQSS
jgi:hypothetical protein